MLLLHPGVYESAGYRHLARDIREVGFPKPASFCYLRLLEVYLSRDIVSIEAHHQTTRIGPRLRCEITDIVDCHACLLQGLTGHSLFESLTCLYETGHQTVIVTFEVLCTYQKNLVTPMDKYYDSCSQL